MSHPAEGVLRRHLDEPAAVGDDDRRHLASCPACARRAAQATRDADLVAGALQDSAGRRPDPDVDAAWARLNLALAAPGPTPSAPPRRSLTARRRPRRRRPVVVAATVTALLLGGTAAAAAADWLPIFATRAVAPVTVSVRDLTSPGLDRLASLAAYGQVDLPAAPTLRSVPDAAAAAAATGAAVPAVTSLPVGVQGSPTYRVSGVQTATFTFSAAQARQAAAADGVSLPPMPEGLDGTSLRLQAGPGVLETWTQDGRIPTLMVARVGAPTVSTQGASLPVVRDYLLSLPGIPADLAAQLRAVTGDGGTLPVPVPQGVATQTQAEVNGAPATVLESTGSTAAAVVWVQDGRLEAVAGPLSPQEVLSVARGLR